MCSLSFRNEAKASTKVTRSGRQNAYWKEPNTFIPVCSWSFLLKTQLTTTYEVLNSTFSEGVNDLDHPNQTPRSMSQRLRKSPPQLNLLLDEFEDSDDDSNDTDQESPAMNDFSMKSGPVDTSLILSDSTHSTAEWDQVEQETLSEDGYTPTPVTPTSSVPQSSSTKPNHTSENPKTTVVVKDAAYITYRAMLYYVNISEISMTRFHMS